MRKTPDHPHLMAGLVSTVGSVRQLVLGNLQV